VKILISNPSKQYTHQTVRALLHNHIPCTFLTAIWYKPQNPFWKLVGMLSPSLKSRLLRKTDTAIPESYVVTHALGTIYKFLARFFIANIERRSFIEDRIHDYWVSKYIKKSDATLVIGFEKSCRDSFKAAKKKGMVAILDLSQVHTHYIQDLRERYPFFKRITGGKKFFQKISALKKEEYQLADHILVLSAFARQTMVDNDIDASKISVVNLGFDPNQFMPKTYAVSSGKLLKLIYVGIVTQRKGIQDLISLMQMLEPYAVGLTIIGPKGDASHLVNTKSSYKNIRYIEYLHHDELVQQLHVSDVFVLPSYLDSWAAVVLEAMACGLPVIITENTGAKDAVTPNCGFVINIGDVNAMYKAVMHFYNNPENIEQMGMYAQKQAYQYTWERYYKNIKTIVEKIN